MRKCLLLTAAFVFVAFSDNCFAEFFAVGGPGPFYINMNGQTTITVKVTPIRLYRIHWMHNGVEFATRSPVSNNSTPQPFSTIYNSTTYGCYFSPSGEVTGEATADLYINIDGYDPNPTDTDWDGIPNEYDPDSGLEDCRIYYAGPDGFTLQQLPTNSVSIVDETTNGTNHVEVWVDPLIMAPLRINENSRKITWHCVLYDKDGNPERDKSGEIIVRPVYAEWRKFPEDFD